MSKKALVIGATGGFGQAMARMLVADGWQVTALMRNPRTLPKGLEAVAIVAGDARNARDVRRAARGVDVIVQGFNVLYPRWGEDWPQANRAAMAAAGDSGATILFPGNIYNYGTDAGAILDEETPQNPDTRKGILRRSLERELEADAKARGYRVIVLRASDYFGPGQNGGWLDDVVVKNLDEGVVRYPAPLESRHSWAYLPDLAKAGLGLLKARDSMKAFETFHFRGHSEVTGLELVNAIRKVRGHDELKVKRLPWWLVRLLGLVLPMMREIYEMRWLWQVPHVLDDRKLRAMLPDLAETPLDTAIAAVIAERKPFSSTQPTELPGSGHQVAQGHVSAIGQ